MSQAEIIVFGGDTPNVLKVLIALEEMALAYRRAPLDILKGEQFAPSFLKISPNNKVPAMIDPLPAEGGTEVSVFESGAILLYLAEKQGRLLPRSGPARVAALEWLMWQMSGQGPMLGQAGHFRNYAPEPIPYAIQRFGNEVARLYRVLDARLSTREYLAEEFSIADIASWPWILFRDHHGIVLEDFPHVERWFRQIEQRSAVRAAMNGVKVGSPTKLDDEARRVLFDLGKDEK